MWSCLMSALTKDRNFWRACNRNSFSCSAGGPKSEIKVSAGLRLLPCPFQLLAAASHFMALFGFWPPHRHPPVFTRLSSLCLYLRVFTGFSYKDISHGI